MFHKNYFLRKPGLNFKLNAASNTEPQPLQKLMVKVNRLNSDNATLRQRIQEKEHKVRTCVSLLLRYESVLKEELALYRLHQSKIKTIEDAFHCYEIFMKDIDTQINLFFENHETSPNLPNQISALKRILLRFIHQKIFNETATDQKLAELERLIAQKQQLISAFQSEVKQLSTSTPSTLLRARIQSRSRLI